MSLPKVLPSQGPHCRQLSSLGSANLHQLHPSAPPWASSDNLRAEVHPRAVPHCHPSASWEFHSCAPPPPPPPETSIPPRKHLFPTTPASPRQLQPALKFSIPSMKQHRPLARRTCPQPSHQPLLSKRNSGLQNKIFCLKHYQRSRVKKKKRTIPAMYGLLC